MGEAAFDKLHRSFDCDPCWSDEEVNVVWHHDIGMQKVAGAVVIEGFEEKRGVALKLEEPRRLWVAVVMKYVPDLAVRLGIAIR